MDATYPLQSLVVVWLLVAAVVISMYWIARVGAGLMLAYILAFWLLHWPAAAAHLIPGYYNVEPNYNPPSQELMSTPDLLELLHERFSHSGFEESTFGLLAFCAGATIAIFWGWLRRARGPMGTGPRSADGDPPLARQYALVGLACYVLISLTDINLPSVTSLIAAGWGLLPVGLAVLCWHAWMTRRPPAFAVWFAAGLGLPLMTIATAGFASYGVTAAMALVSLVASFVRPKWKVLVCAVLLALLAPSFYVTYMRDRTAIRESAWAESRGALDRIRQMGRTFSSPEVFDPFNNVHISYITFRLNQNELVGAARYYMDLGAADPAGGATISAALLGLVPRIIWPSKPVVAGSGDLVARYTGYDVAEGTSVGVGHLLELYANFGTTGVCGGLFLLGLVLTAVDVRAGEYLGGANWRRFALWYLPGMSFLQVGGSLSELVTTAAASVVVVLIVNNALDRRVPAVAAPQRPARAETFAPL